MSSKISIRRALLSVYDKTGLIELARALVDHEIELISTGGTARALTDAGLPVRDVSDVTGFPEMMDGRLKTLHPKIHGGLLAVRDDSAHLEALETHAIAPIDLLVVNLYPFEREPNLENIDIGGPAMIRAAAKNHGYAAVLTDPKDYAPFMRELNEKKAIGLETRRRLAGAAFARVAAYDARIADWLAESVDGKGERDSADGGNADMPAHRTFGGSLLAALRYGENPHQEAALYGPIAGEQVGGQAGKNRGIAQAEQVQGRELSYNNLNDADAALDLIGEFADGDQAAIAIIKHANPCGAALGDSLEQAYESALACDPLSAFGGIVAANRPLDGATAKRILKLFTEIVLAPDADEEARAVLAQKPELRLLLTDIRPASGLAVRSIAGGFLVQEKDSMPLERDSVKIVTKRAPDESQWADMLFAFRVAKHVKSNAIVYAKGGATIGIGAGQPSRMDSARIAAQKAQDAGKADELSGCVCASDAFFPFADGLLCAANAGAKAIIQPGGSKRDAEIIKAADEAGLAMAFTGTRHFRH